MDPVLYTALLRNIATVVGILGIILGIDLILGAPIVNTLRRILDRCFDFDKIIIDPKARRMLGIAFLIFSVLMILVVSKIPLPIVK
jgi:hypothetical protein